MRKKDTPNQKESFLQKNHEKILFTALLFGVPLVLNLLLTFGLPNIPVIKDLFLTGDKLNNATWLDFWGSYLGALIGVVPAYLALTESRKQAKQLNEENELNRALSVRPYITVSFTPLPLRPDNFSEYSFYFDLKHPHVFPFGSKNIEKDFGPDFFNKNSRRFIKVEFTNIGMGPAIDIDFIREAGDFGIDCLGPGQTRKCILVLPILTKEETEYKFSIKYTDIFSKSYKYRMRIISSEDVFSAETLEPES